MRTPKLLRQLIILCTQMIPSLTLLIPFQEKRTASLQPLLVKCFTFLFFLFAINNSNVFAQESIDTTKWISPDIPRNQVALRPLAARPVAAQLQSQALAVLSSPNPDIPQSLLCQNLKIVFVLDESGSITGSEITSVKNGALALANALLNSGATLQLIEFNTTASTVNLGVTQVDNTYITRLTSYLNSSYNGQSYAPISANPCTGWTNWQDAMKSVGTITADLVIFFTDGNPTAYNLAGGNCSGTVSAGQSESLSLDAAVTQANTLKSQGKHMFVVGVGNANEININNIKAISGNDVFGPSNDILTADYSQPPFENLAANLTAAVNAICGTELLVDKTSSNSGVCSGQTVTFTNSVTNTGGDFNFKALTVIAKDVYPSGYSNLQFVPSAPAGASISGNTVTYNIGDMLANQTVTYQIKATVLAPVPAKNYNTVISAIAYNANEARDSISVLSGYATASIDTTSCVPVVINGSTYSSNGTYTQTLVSTAGCDSVLTIKVTISEPTTTTETVVQCDTYTWPLNGVTYTESGTYSVSSTSAAGCMHTEILVLTIKKSTSNTTNASACTSYLWALNGVTYTTGGTYSVTSTNAAGCTHTETLILTINNNTSNTSTAGACDSYTWPINGTTYTESGTYNATSTNEAGCTHTETLILTISKSTSHSTPVKACDSYTWPLNNITYTTGGTYSIISTNDAGCTHTESLELTINKSTSHSTPVTACDSYTWAVNNVTYTTGGSYSVTSVNDAGCTHTETLELTLNKSTSHTTEATACDSYTWDVNGTTYTQSGTYSVPSINDAGCTHTETLILTINNSTSHSTPVTACDSYTWQANGLTYTESGSYQVTSTNASGCTHTETLVLTINQSTSNTTNVVECNSYTWPVNGVTYTTGGTYSVTSINAAGCTHTEILVLGIGRSTSNTTTTAACDSYTWAVNNVTYTSGGTYSVTSTNAAGCTHTETLALTINNSTSHTTTAAACDSYTWAVNGVTYTSGGTYAVTSANAAGCTHTEMLELTINKSTSHSTTVNGCNSYTWPLNGVTYTTGGTYSVTSVNTSGCTHTETLELTIGKATSHTTTISACNSYTWAVNGVTYTTGGTYTVNSTNASGCPNTEILVLTINKGTNKTTTTAACNSYKWPVNGITYTASGTYTVTTNNSYGCANTETLVLTINKSTSNTSTASACNSYKWALNAVTYTASGTYTVTSTNYAGCTHTEKLVLTINKSVSTITTTSACNSYKWSVNGATYTASGTYTTTSTNSYGCSCSHTLILTINKAPLIGAISGPLKVCRNQTGIQYSVPAVSNATSYTWVLPTGATGSSTSNSITVAFGSTFSSGYVKVRANNSCGTSVYAQITVVAPTAIPSTCSSISGTRLYCGAGNYTYSIPAVAGATNYIWTVTGSGLSIVSGQGTTSLTVAATSSFAAGTISVKASNCVGSNAAVAISVTGSKIPAKPGPVSGPVTGVCKKANVIYSIAAVAGATSYTWTIPSGITLVSGAGTNSIKVTFGTAVTSSCSISVKANNACGSSAVATLAISTLPAAPGAITGITSVTRSQTAVVYSIVAVADATSYTWTISGGAKFVGSATGNAVTVSFATATSATAVITVKANNACGSSAASSKTIAVASGYAARGINNGAVVEEITKTASDFIVYPNPSKGQFNVSFNTMKMDKVAIKVVDLTGRIIYQSANTYAEGPQLSKINISRFTRGMYMVQILKNNEVEKVVKVIVE